MDRCVIIPLFYSPRQRKGYRDMNFISIVFILFFSVFFIIYYAVPNKYRYIPLAAGSYLFYGWGNIRLIFILLLVTLITYVGGYLLEKRRSKKIYVLFFMMSLSLLFIFKYLSFFTETVNALFGRPGNDPFSEAVKNLILPVGLSFYIFQSLTYLGDIYHGKMKTERNLVRYAAFAAFFPSILSGPIQKAHILLPQIRKPADFDSERAIKGFILLIWGVFQKIVVANNLAAIADTVFNNYGAYLGTGTLYFITAAVCFSLYIYADFSSYSDMARGIAKILGIEIRKNFNNPYLSLSCAEFWRRWHISLNEWLMEYVYIPLGGNRKGTPRKYMNLFIVFLLSGIWHGASWNFVLWGGVNGLLVIGGQWLRPVRKKFYTVFQVNKNCETFLFLRRAVVFCLITVTWVFFRNSISSSCEIIRQMAMLYPARLFMPELLTIGGSELQTLEALVMALLFCIIQYCRKDERKYYAAFRRQPVFIQGLVLAVLLYLCAFKTLKAGRSLNSQFLYFQF